ncbi:MAG: DMT family transporter [Leptonema sp. (in: Bacteria)]|nr:DMT family transporter [Leptonema sp. (in: bacteria)]
MIGRFKAELFLILATVVWGGTFPVISELLSFVDAAYIVGFRFLISAVILFPFLFKGGLFLRIRQGLVDGFILGSLTFSGFYLQTVGLNYTTPARSAFITQLLLIYVLIFQVFAKRKRPTIWNVISTVILFIGAVILVDPFALEGKLNKGDIITGLSAAAFAAYIIRIDHVKSEGRMVSILFSQFVLCSVLGFTLSFVQDAPVPIFNFTSVGFILYLAIPATLFATYTMLKYQPKTTPMRASILYSLEPIFATLITILFLGIWPLKHEVIGGSIVFFAVILSEVSPLLRHTTKPEPKN